MITTLGREAILRYIAGYTPQLAEAIVLGVGSSAPNISNTRLEHEAVRVNVSSIGADLVNNKIIFKGTLPASLEGQYYEGGLFTLGSSQGSALSRSIFNFSSNEVWTGGNFLTTKTRVGHRSLEMSAPAGGSVTATLEDSVFDFSDYSAVDMFNLAYTVDSTPSQLSLRLGNDSTNYFQYNINSPAVGYRISTATKGSASLFGSPTWNDIKYIQLVLTSPGGAVSNVDIDSLRIEDVDTLYTPYALICRATFTPIVKIAGIPMDIEYPLDIVI